MSEIDVAPFENHQWWWHTYIFKEFKNFDGSIYSTELFNELGDNGKPRSIKDSDCIIYELIKAPNEPPYDNWINTKSFAESLYFTHFKEVFKEDFDYKGHWPRFDFDRIILPESLFNEICEFIDKNNLTSFKDLLLFIIAKGQDIVTSHEFLYSQYDKKKNTVRNIKKTTETLIKLIDRVLPEYKEPMEEKDYHSPLQNIQFKFKNKKDTITISDLNFCRDIISSFKDRFNDGFYKNWRKQLKSYQEILISEYLEVYNFKFLYAKALYSFFTQSNIIPLTGKLYPNELMKCIYTIMEYSLIQIGKKDDLPEDKIKDVRNWVRDHTLNKRHSAAPIIADLDKLKKYFEPDFINSVTDIKKLDSVSIAVFITERFDLQNIFKELVHIISSFNIVRFFYYSPLPNNDNTNLPPDYIAFKELFRDIKDKKKLSKLSLTMDGKDYTLSDKLPLHVIEQALNSYYKENEFEFDTSLLEQHVKLFPETHQGQTFYTGKMSNPENRFFVRFISSFYNFLSAESGYKERESIHKGRRMTKWDIEEFYYAVIALVLKNTWFFHHMNHSEQFIIDKVRYWHELSKFNEK